MDYEISKCVRLTKSRKHACTNYDGSNFNDEAKSSFSIQTIQCDDDKRNDGQSFNGLVEYWEQY